jgi:hypothetical protein
MLAFTHACVTGVEVGSEQLDMVVTTQPLHAEDSAERAARYAAAL